MVSKTGMEMLDDLIFELKATTAADPSSSSGLSKKKEKKERGGEETKQKRQSKVTNAPAPSKDELNLNSLDLRVGQIVSVKKHDTADKLYCEEIDIGEEEPRQIASGLVPHYTLEEMQGRRLIVVANLKPRALMGFKSCGMVLCAAKGMGLDEKVEFLEPPADAPLGARVTAEGLKNEPLSQKQCDKQKAFAVVAVDLHTDEDGVGKWKELRLLCEGKPCVAPTVRGGEIR